MLGEGEAVVAGNSGQAGGILGDEGSVMVQVSHSRELDILYDYFIRERHGDPIPFNRQSVIGLVLEILGGTGGIYAWPPAWEYARDRKTWVRYAFAISNPASNALFLMNATDGLIDSISREINCPPQITYFTDVLTKKGLVIKHLKLAAGSIICVVPFAIAAYMFPPSGCKVPACLAVVVTHSALSNVILHAVAWGVILTPAYWYYRLPFLPIEKLWHVLTTVRQSPQMKKLRTVILEQDVISSKYKGQLAETMLLAANSIVGQYFKTGRSPLRAIHSKGAEYALYDFIELAELQLQLNDQTQLSGFRRALQKVNAVLSKGGVGFLGAGIMVTGCMGWIANPIFIPLKEGLTLAPSIVIGALPLYSTAVLCAFYGAGIWNQIYRYFTHWTGQFGDKVPFEARMYPKSFALFMLANLFISFFAYGTAAQLIDTVFAAEVWDDIRPELRDISMPMLMILSFVPLIELFCLVVRKSQAKFGSLENDNTLAARLLVKMPVLVHYLQEMKPQALMESIAVYTDDQQKALGIDPELFRLDRERFNVLETEKGSLEQEIEQQKIYARNVKRTFFGGKGHWRDKPSSDEVKGLLANQKGALSTTSFPTSSLRASSNA